MQERQLDYDNFLKQLISNYPSFECRSLYRFTDKEKFYSLLKELGDKIFILDNITLLKPITIDNRQFEEEKAHYYFIDDEGKYHFCMNLRPRTFTYNQPSSDSVERYIRLRKYSLKYMKRLEAIRKEDISNSYTTLPSISRLYPKEKDLYECLEWIKHVLQIVESENKQQIQILPPPSYETISELNKSYPNISKVIDFYSNKLVYFDKEVIEHDEYKTITKKQPLVDALKEGLKKLRNKTKSYYIDKIQNFLSETEITHYLEDHINIASPSVRTKREVEDGPSKIDLLLYKEDQNEDLAVEAKIAYKQGKFQTAEVRKALFSQMICYAETVGRSSCAVLYAFDVKLADVNQRVKDVVLKESKWSLSPNNPNDMTHHKLKMMDPGIGEYTFDVFVVCLHSKSNTQKELAKRKN